MAIPFPHIDPVAFSLGPVPLLGHVVGPLQVRWYALAYLAGILLGWKYAVYLVGKVNFRPNTEDIDEFITWVVLGIILGGRVGYVLVYGRAELHSDPWEMLRIWHGGMSFHGGMAGLALAMYVFARLRGINFLALTDVVGCVTPIGLFTGRLANFINGELWGRTTTVPWGMVFPNGGPDPRHPSQLYQATMEGLMLLVLLAWLAGKPEIRNRPGILTGVFLIWYGIVRIVAELFRQPDVQMGYYLYGTVTMGQILSLPMVFLGLYLVAMARRRPPIQPAATVVANLVRAAA